MRTSENSHKLLEEVYKSLFLIRHVEEKICDLYPTDKIKSPVHLSIGQEAVSVGVCKALTREDGVMGSCRGHAMYLAKGGNLKQMFAELYGKRTGCGKGRAGSMHLADVQAGVIATSAIMASTVPLAVGWAYAQAYQNTGNIGVCFVGDGALDEGCVHESFLFAKQKKVPILIVCENNEYAIHSHFLTRHPSKDYILNWASSYEMKCKRFEDDDPLALYDYVGGVADELRSGSGPQFIECYTSRWKEHVGPGDDFKLGYRGTEEVEKWKRKDQLIRIGKLLKPTVKQKIEQNVLKEIQEAVEFAECSPFPKPTELYENVYGGENE
ncbi:MAG: thiamine pyrophosphate-dependent dehydrogenase E1 component subunit alpha [Zetaproteobacteria bacterium]|nr:thiamine pyrophosphate-dependent dehydrogenase E1 component subunit alpha [Zetaproteobacteria bacterium]